MGGVNEFRLSLLYQGEVDCHQLTFKDHTSLKDHEKRRNFRGKLLVVGQRTWVN